MEERLFGEHYGIENYIWLLVVGYIGLEVSRLLDNRRNEVRSLAPL